MTAIRRRLRDDRGENSIMQTISIAVSAILIAAGLITAPSLINNARDTNVKQDLANIGISQEAYLSNDGTYAKDIPSLSSGAGVNLRLSAGSDPAIVTGSDCYAAFDQSMSGSYFYRTSASTAISRLNPWPTTAPARYPSHCSWPAAPFTSSGTPYVNPIMNASFETPDPGFAPNVNTNLALNPEGLSGSPVSWGGGGGNASVTTSPTAPIIVTHTNGAPSGNAFVVIPVAMNASSTYRAKVSFKEVSGTPSGLYLSVRDGFSGFSGGGGNLTRSASGIWSIELTFTTYATAPTTPQFIVDFVGPGTGETIQVNAPVTVISATGTAIGAGFDGNTSPGGGYTYAWTGVANGSPSVQNGVGVLGSGPDGGRIGYQSAIGAVDGTHSIAVPAYSNIDSFSAINGMLPTLKPNTTYTIVGTITLTSVQSGPLASQARAFRAYIDGSETVFTYTQTAPNAPGTYEVRATFTTGATGAVGFFRLENGSSTQYGNDPVYWDNLVLI